MPRISKGQRVSLSGAMILISILLERSTSYSGISDALMIAAAFVAGYPIAVGAIRALRYRILGIDALVTIAVTGALLISEYWEAAAVTFLFMFGSYLESRTIEKTRSAIKSLLELAPDTARVIRDKTVPIPKKTSRSFHLPMVFEVRSVKIPRERNSTPKIKRKI